VPLHVLQSYATVCSLEAVTQHQQQRQALALLVGTRGGLGGLHTRNETSYDALIDSFDVPGGSLLLLLQLQAGRAAATVVACLRPLHGLWTAATSTNC
jgi:hypothetical protein